MICPTVILEPSGETLHVCPDSVLNVTCATTTGILVWEITDRRGDLLYRQVYRGHEDLSETGHALNGTVTFRLTYVAGNEHVSVVTVIDILPLNAIVLLCSDNQGLVNVSSINLTVSGWCYIVSSNDQSM